MATGIGETLVAARRQQGVALSDAAAETRVRESYLAALEAEDFAALGGDVYVKGFLRSYARFLRLDPEPLIATYRAHHEHHEETSPLAQQPVSRVPLDRNPMPLIVAGVIVLVIAVFALIGWLGGNDDPDVVDLGDPAPVENEPTLPPTAAPTTEPAQPSDAPTDAPTEVLTAEGVRLRLDLDNGPSWMRVIVDGETELEGEQPEGASLRFKADESITVRIGDAGAVRVTVNGRDRGLLGDSSEVVDKTYTADDPA
jgi:hypothetical protein